MATCSSCNAEVVPGTRWCNICHTNVVNPSLGKLASPGKRLGAFILDLVIPFLWILFDKDNQGWHDKLMSTYVTA